MDKTSLIKRISTIEGLTNEERSALLGLLRSHKKYGLVWEDKVEDVEERLRDQLPVLREAKDKYILSDDPEAPNHIIIEGDNLEALTALSYTHEGKIDVIYIDPPYNTGNKDFVYNDSYVDSEDSYRHSKWLSFMNKRLKIAKRLLSEKGVILISINDIELYNLKILSDSIFGENNYLANFIWQSTPGSNTGEDIKTVTEYVLSYAKNINYVKVNQIIIDDDDKYNMEDKYVEYRGKYTLNKLDRRMTGSHYSEALNYPITVPDGTLIYPGGTISKQEHWNWRWSKNKVQWGIQNGFIEFKKSNTRWAIYFKQYLFVNNNDEKISRALPYQNLIKDIDGLNSARGTQEIMSLMNSKAFDYPKPIALLLHLLKCISHKSSIILDFFAGSGTTLHATMQLNAEDGGHRQCILVTNNENNICEDVTYERNKRVIIGYTTPKGQKVEGLHSNRLRYYRTDFISRDRTQRNMRQLVNAATDMLCIKEDLYTEQQVLGRWKMIPQVARYFTDGKKHMLVVYNEQAASKLAEIIAETDFGGAKLKIYIFSPERYAFDDDFYEVQDKVQLVALPAAIYDAYQKVLPKRKPQLLETAKETKTIQPTQQDLFAQKDNGNYPIHDIEEG